MCVIVFSLGLWSALKCISQDKKRSQIHSESSSKRGLRRGLYLDFSYFSDGFKLFS